MDYWERNGINFYHIVIVWLTVIAAASVHGHKKGTKEIKALEQYKSQYQDSL